MNPGWMTRSGFGVFHVPITTVVQAFFGADDEQSQLLLRIVYVLAGMFAFAEIVLAVYRIHDQPPHHPFRARRVSGHPGPSEGRSVAQNTGAAQRSARPVGPFLQSNEFINQSACWRKLWRKKRLEQELEIAREVQATLFPKQLPQPPGMAIFGGCKAARTVSGDYYDFIAEDETHLNIVVGDISGKGISAALLMANLQAAMRSQLLSSKHEDPDAAGQILADIMTQLNRQIYLNSPPEKYATLFLSRYDADARRLWYCNAGHLPPIVLDAQGFRTLEATGTVVGLFPDAVYRGQIYRHAARDLAGHFHRWCHGSPEQAEEEFGDGQLLEALRVLCAHARRDLGSRM